ncbi:WD40-repeat-containing domain protein [Mycena crocata]|nr:WD40-repeat-containing domain protein [Mycena crocata]
MADSTYTLRATLTPPKSGKAAALNCLLFFDQGRMLASGGDDQYLRTWDVLSGDCHQELTDARWGQVTNLTLLDNSPTESPVLFIGTGRGLVSAYPWSRMNQQFNKQAAATTVVFPSDHPVESQALDSTESQFVVVSLRGDVRMYTVHDRKVLHLSWQLKIPDIPRHIMFDRGQVVMHSVGAGKIYYFSPVTGDRTGEKELRIAVGNVAISPNGRIKVVHNMSKNTFDVYDPADSADPISFTIQARTNNKIKGIVFSGDSETLVCGSDGGAFLFDVITRQVREPKLDHNALNGADVSAVVALTTCSTRDYHFIASGESETPALIYIWEKPTHRKQEEERQMELHHAAEAAELTKQQKIKDDALKEAKKQKDAVDAQKAEIEELAAFVELIYLWFYWGLSIMVVAALALACWWWKL